MNTVIWPDTGKSHDYRHDIKGLEKPKCYSYMVNDIGHIFQGIRDIEVADMYLFIHRHKIPLVQADIILYNQRWSHQESGHTKTGT